MMAINLFFILRRSLRLRICCTRCTHGNKGSGVGHGGGGGGTIREAGGAFGEMEAAKENQYFYKKQAEQLKELKDHIVAEMEFHKDQIKHHQDALQRSQKQARDFEANKPR